MKVRSVLGLNTQAWQSRSNSLNLRSVLGNLRSTAVLSDILTLYLRVLRLQGGIVTLKLRIRHKSNISILHLSVWILQLRTLQCRVLTLELRILGLHMSNIPILQLSILVLQIRTLVLQSNILTLELRTLVLQPNILTLELGVLDLDLRNIPILHRSKILVLQLTSILV